MSRFGQPRPAPKSLTREQKRKVALVKAALQRSDNAVKDHLISLGSYERAAMTSQYGLHGATGDIMKSTPGWPDTIRKLHDEVLRAQDRLDALHTGLHAERLLSQSLGEFAAGADNWRHGLSSGDGAEVERSSTAMRRHWTRATALAKAGFAELERGR
jgi:hypothetical protein